MRVLLDTNAFLWWDDQRERLSEAALAACTDSENVLFVSSVSIWEIQIKTQLGKLSLRVPLEQTIQEQQQLNDVRVLHLELSHIYQLEHLPPMHRDPFDRLLIAQSQVEGMTLVSSDSMFASYGASLIW